jgi:hypothetical protein
MLLAIGLVHGWSGRKAQAGPQGAGGPLPASGETAHRCRPAGRPPAGEPPPGQSEHSEQRQRRPPAGGGRWGDGTLFLIGTHENSVIGVGEDWTDLYRVTNGTGSNVVITKVGKKHLYCSYPSPGAGSSQENHCNLDAAGGVYIDPNRQLLLYGTEHDNAGPESTVRFMEFRSITPNPDCAIDINSAWVELYDDSDFTDRGFMIDFPDHDLENCADYDRLEGFEDKASAVRWLVHPARLALPAVQRQELHRQHQRPGRQRRQGARRLRRRDLVVEVVESVGPVVPSIPCEKTCVSAR